MSMMKLSTIVLIIHTGQKNYRIFFNSYLKKLFAARKVDLFFIEKLAFDVCKLQTVSLLAPNIENLIIKI